MSPPIAHFKMRTPKPEKGRIFIPRLPFLPKSPFENKIPKRRVSPKPSPLVKEQKSEPRSLTLGEDTCTASGLQLAAALRLKTGTPFYFKGKMLAVMPGWLY